MLDIFTSCSATTMSDSSTRQLEYKYTEKFTEMLWCCIDAEFERIMSAYF